MQPRRGWMVSFARNGNVRLRGLPGALEANFHLLFRWSSVGLIWNQKRCRRTFLINSTNESPGKSRIRGFSIIFSRSTNNIKKDSRKGASQPRDPGMKPKPSEKLQEEVILDHDNPWPGLVSFTEANSAFFSGRERESEKLARLI